MSPSNFTHLEQEFPLLYNLGLAAEYNLHNDPVTALFKLRQFVERFTETLFEEHCIEFPRENTIHNRLKTLEYEGYIEGKIKDLLFIIKNKGNIAVHDNKGSVDDAKGALYSAFVVSKWLYSTYAFTPQDISDLRFSVPEKLDTRHALHELEKQHEQLKQKFDELLATRSTQGLPAEKEQAIKQLGKANARNIDLTEAQTRELIDAQLADAGWEVNTEELNFHKNKTLPQRGRNMAIAEWPVGKKRADYALFIGTQLYGIVEAKRYKSDISGDLTQAKIYAELAEARHEAELLGEWRGYHAPFLFATNGRDFLSQLTTKSGIWFLDVRRERNHSRALKAWMSPEGLQKLFEQDIEQADQSLQDSDLSYLQSVAGLSLRDYQIEAIRRVEACIRQAPESGRALLAMATGTGKTRTIMGLCYRLIKSNRFRRILFLVDRRLLAQQAFNAFQDNKVEDLHTFGEIYQVKGLKDLIPDIDTRLHFATVQGMVKRLFYTDKDENKEKLSLPVDAYDCIIVDEAHRGYLLDKEMDEEELDFKNQLDYVSKYRMVLDYFDAFAIGLTATPALHTAEIFGKAVFNYSYREAVIDGFLIDHEPPFILKTKLSEEGMIWEKGEKPKAYDMELNTIIELDELEDELHIEIEGFNRLVITESFNRTVIRELVQHLDPEGEEKTLIFAARDSHADLVVKILKEEFARIGEEVPEKAIEKITGKSYGPVEQLRRFKNEKYPNIVVTVDLLTTGIDVPAITNLVFLRRIRSRILYEQMLGRATRLCPEINKEVFHIFDAVRIYEALKDYTQMKPISVNPKASFQQLAAEMPDISSAERTEKQVEQIIAKLQRKKQYLDDSRGTQFQYHSQGQKPEDFIDMLKSLSPAEAADKILQYSNLWRFLDELRPNPTHQLVSEHTDEFVGSERGYGKGQKPEDYLQSFEQFIRQNRNKIEALHIICTRPAALDRASLKALKLQLDAEGFNTRALNTAWKSAKNEDIAADIISYIRTLAIGSSLVSHEDRIRKAINHIRQMKEWNKMQRGWINRFEMQLLAESVLQKEDLDKEPFKRDGGFERLNKIFDNQLDSLLSTIHVNLYGDMA